MLKHILVVFILGAVFFKETSADIECFLKEVEAAGGRQPNLLPSDASVLCKGYVDILRVKLRACSVTTISLDKLESYVKEWCTAGSQLNNDIISSKSCFNRHTGDYLDCMPKYNKNNTSVTTRMTEYCKQRRGVYKCVKSALGEPCGPEGLNVVRKDQESQESYLKEVCVLVGGATVNSLFVWIVVLCFSFTMLISY